MPEPTKFTTGGTVQAGGGIYVRRGADEELLQGCLAGDFSYVLTSRQMGKSSLMIETARRLVEYGVRPVIADLTEIGSRVTEDEWYSGFLTLICRDLQISTLADDWWKAHNRLGPTQRLFTLFDEAIMPCVKEPIVIFVDEIDTTLGLSFTDDFFAVIRAVYNGRASRPNLRRLTFVLIGAASPMDLIRDKSRTPFNIGHPIELRDFTLSEAECLVEIFSRSTSQRTSLLQWIFAWTQGHPYLTVRVCREIARKTSPHFTKELVDNVVHSIFFDENAPRDSNLHFVERMLTNPSPRLRGVLPAYREVLLTGGVADEEQSLILSQVKLSGVVRKQDGYLRIRNQIYSTVFDPRWIERQILGGTSRQDSGVSSVLEMASVLFMDIVGYSLLALDSQVGHLALLQGVVRASAAFERADTSSTVVSLPTGDGMALVFLGDPELCAQCAVEINAALKQHSTLHVRMGLHVGPVYRVTDINTNRNVAGGGINIAQRVMDIGDAGHILLSAAIAEVLMQFDRWKAHIHKVGRYEHKHGNALEVYNLYTRDYGNATVPAKVVTLSMPQGIFKRGRLVWLAVLMCIIAAICYYFRFRRG